MTVAERESRKSSVVSRDGALTTSMLWFFSRDGQSLRVETRYDSARAEYVVTEHRPDGCQQSERFTSALTFRERLVEIEDRLEAERWTRTGPPVFLWDDWPIKPAT